MIAAGSGAPAAKAPADASPVGAGSFRARALRAYAARAWALMRSRALHVALVGLAVAAVDFLRIWPQLPAGAPVLSRFLPELVYTVVIAMALVVAAISLAQATTLRGARRLAAMLASALAAVALGVAATMVLAAWTSWGYPVQHHIVASVQSYAMFTAWEWSAVAIALVLVYAVHEREAALAARARETELLRVEQQRSVMESGLAVLRARVEPEFLFGALDEVRALYRRDRASADAMVDALIVYLRAALPRMRGEGSTIGREIELARAYVAVLQVSRGDALAVDDRVDEPIRDAPMPPMVLLPLTQAAFACGAVDMRRRYAIEAAGDDGAVTIRLAVEGGTRPDGWLEPGPDASRRTLHAYFGDHARLSFGSRGTRHWVEIAIPNLARNAR